MTTHFDDAFYTHDALFQKADYDDAFYTHDALCIHTKKVLLYIVPVGNKQLNGKFNWHSNFVI